MYRSDLSSCACGVQSKPSWGNLDAGGWWHVFVSSLIDCVTHFECAETLRSDFDGIGIGCDLHTHTRKRRRRLREIAMGEFTTINTLDTTLQYGY